MLSNALYLTTLVATASLAVASAPAHPHGDMTRRDPAWGRQAAVSAPPKTDAKHKQSTGHSFKSVKKGPSSSHASQTGKKGADFGRSTAVKRQTVPLGNVADTAAPILAAAGPASGSSTPGSSASTPDDSLPVNLAAVPSSSTGTGGSPLSILNGLPLPLAKRADALASVLSGSPVAAAVAPLVNAPVTNNAILNGGVPLLNVNQPAINVLSPGATTNQVTAQNYAPNGTIVQGNNNRVTTVDGNNNKVNTGDTNQSVQGNNNKVAFGNSKVVSLSPFPSFLFQADSSFPPQQGSARGSSGGQRPVTKVAKTNNDHDSNTRSSSSSTATSRGNTHRKAASRAKVAKSSKSKVPSHSVADDAEEDFDNSRACNVKVAAAPAATKTKVRTLYKTVTRTVTGPTATPSSKHLLDLDLEATVDKVANAVAGVNVL
ncbi:hypothetical protein JCM11641_006633 [Rhodosporidiobolus odoratus]